MSTREAARWLFGEMRAEIDALPFPDPAPVERVVRATARRGSPVLVSRMATLAGVPMLERELDRESPGVLARLIELEQSRVRAKPSA